MVTSLVWPVGGPAKDWREDRGLRMFTLACSLTPARWPSLQQLLSLQDLVMALSYCQLRAISPSLLVFFCPHLCKELQCSHLCVLCISAWDTDTQVFLWQSLWREWLFCLRLVFGNVFIMNRIYSKAVDHSSTPCCWFFTTRVVNCLHSHRM